MNEFEIIYADGSVVRGTTEAEFLSAPEGPDFADDGIQFVITRADDGPIVKQDALSVYEFNGVKKSGGWTDRDNYDFLVSQLHRLSNLL